MMNISKLLKPNFDSRRLFWPVMIAVAALAVALIVVTVGFYRWNWRGPVAKIVSRVLPYPAAVIDGRSVLWSTYRDELAAQERFYRLQLARAASGSILPSKDELSRRALDRLIDDALVEGLAEKYAVSVSAAEVEKAYAQATSKQALNEIYGLTPSEFRDRVIRPALLRQKLQAKIAPDEGLNVTKLAKAQAAATELKSGMKFDDVYIQYDEASNAANRGNLGLIGPGLLPAEADAALKGAKSGDILGPIKTALGYLVLKVGESKVVNGVRKTAIQEIVIRPIQLDELLAQRRQTASIVIFVTP